MERPGGNGLHDVETCLHGKRTIHLKNLRSKQVLDLMAELNEDFIFTMTFWSRHVVSDMNLVPMPSSIFEAICFACGEVEDRLSLTSLASIEIRSVPSGGVTVTATMHDRVHQMRLDPCSICGAPVYENVHPYNGCVKVVAEEVMNS